MDWESRYRVKDTPWDLGKPSPALACLLEEKALLFRNVAQVLVPGCGRGHDARLLAEKIPRVTGLDLSPLALAEARRLDEEKQVDWQQGDFLKKIEVPEPKYDLIWEHTCYCAIPPDQRVHYVINAHHLLKPGGFLLGVFFLDPGIPLQDGPPFGTSLANLKKTFGSHFVLEWHDPSPRAVPDRQGREVLVLWRRLGACSDGTSAS